MEFKVDLTPSWNMVLCGLVPRLLENSTREGRLDALELLKEAADKLDLLSAFVDENDEVLFMLQRFQAEQSKLTPKTQPSYGDEETQP